MKRSRLRRKNCPDPSPEKARRRYLALNVPLSLSLYLENMMTMATARPVYCAMTVPQAMPLNPIPSKDTAPAWIPRARTMLETALITFTARSVAIGLIPSCIPMNHPFNAIRLRVAGAAHMRMKKYPDARASTSGEQSTKRKAPLTKSHCMAISTTDESIASPTALVRMRPAALSSPRPYACAARPPVPALRNPKFQYSRSKSIVPTAIPPIREAACMESPGTR